MTKKLKKHNFALFPLSRLSLRFLPEIKRLNKKYYNDDDFQSNVCYATGATYLNLYYHVWFNR